MDITELPYTEFTGTVIGHPTTVKISHDYAAVVPVDTGDGIHNVVLVGLDALKITYIGYGLSDGAPVTGNGWVTTVGNLESEWFSRWDVRDIDDLKTALRRLGLDDDTEIVRMRRLTVE